MATVLQFTWPAVAVAAGGGAIAAWRPPSPRTTSIIQHLAAGILFAAAALEMLPHERAGARLPVALGFALGLALMLGLRAASARLAPEGGRTPEGRHEMPWRLVAVSAVDLAIDGLVLGVAFALGETAGTLLAIALYLEIFFLALSIGASMVQAAARTPLVVGAPAMLAAVFAACAVVGRSVFAGLPPFAFSVVLGVGLVALLYLVTEELLVEAHEVEETSWSIAAFFVGFLLFLLIEMTVEGR